MTIEEGSDGTGLNGRLVQLPFSGGDFERQAVREFNELRGEQRGQNILVLGRSPTVSKQTGQLLERRTGAEQELLTVRSVSQQAKRHLGELNEQLDILSPAERNAFLIQYEASYEWNNEYLRNAREKGSFAKDLDAIVTLLLKRPGGLDSEDPVLGALSEFAESFYTDLRNAGYIEQSAVLRYVLERLNEGATVSAPFDSVLVLDFEEFGSRERRYLSMLAADADLTCIGTRDASVLRVLEESGSIDSHVDMEKEMIEPVPVVTRPTAVAHWLATKDTLSGDDGDIRRIHGQTMTEQVRAIGTEIKRVVSQEAVDYADVAVVFRDSRAPVGDAVETLWGMGIPVSSTAVTGLEHDEAARELLAVAKAVAARVTDERETEQALSLLMERLHNADSSRLSSVYVDELLSVLVDGLADGNDSGGTQGNDGRDEDTGNAVGEVDASYSHASDGRDDADYDIAGLLSELGYDTLDDFFDDIGDLSGFNDVLRAWVNLTRLKERIVDENGPLKTRLVFDHLRTILDLSSFVDRTGSLTPGWSMFVEILEHEFNRTASQTTMDELESQETGVTVDTAFAIKNQRFNRVFIVNVVDGEYPSEPGVNRLIPVRKAVKLSEYPGVTDVGWPTVEATFSTPSRELGSAYVGYHQALDRRLLAVASRATTSSEIPGVFDRLYYCTYEEDRHGLGKRVGPSRYLDDLEDSFGDLEMSTAAERNRTPEDAALAAVDEATERARLATDDELYPDELASLSSAIRTVLEAQDDVELSEALRYRLDRGQGVIGHD